jgi:hypothetical protein
LWYFGAGAALPSTHRMRAWSRYGAAAADPQDRPSGPPLASQRRPNSVVARVVDWGTATTLFGRAAASFENGRTRRGRASRGVPGSVIVRGALIAGMLCRHNDVPRTSRGVRRSQSRTRRPMATTHRRVENSASTRRAVTTPSSSDLARIRRRSNPRSGCRPAALGKVNFARACDLGRWNRSSARAPGDRCRVLLPFSGAGVGLAPPVPLRSGRGDELASTLS